MNDFILINEKRPMSENGYHNGVSKNGHSNGSVKVEHVNGVNPNGANGNGAIEIERPARNRDPASDRGGQRATLPAARRRHRRSRLLGSELGPQFTSEPGGAPNRRMRSRSEAACARQPVVLGPRDHQPLRRFAERRRDRRHRGRDSGRDSLRDGQARARSRQVDAGREAAGHVERGSQRPGEDRAREQADPDGRAHFRIQRAGAEDARDHRVGRARRRLLHQFGARKSRTVSARRERDLGSRDARHLDHPELLGGPSPKQ